jgi:hypothetical protein
MISVIQKIQPANTKNQGRPRRTDKVKSKKHDSFKNILAEELSDASGSAPQKKG